MHSCARGAALRRAGPRRFTPSFFILSLSLSHAHVLWSRRSFACDFAPHLAADPPSVFRDRAQPAVADRPSVAHVLSRVSLYLSSPRFFSREFLDFSEVAPLLDACGAQRPSSVFLPARLALSLPLALRVPLRPLSVLFSTRARASRRTARTHARKKRVVRDPAWPASFAPARVPVRISLRVHAFLARRRFSRGISSLPACFEVIRVDSVALGEGRCGPVRTTRRDSRPGAFPLAPIRTCTCTLHWRSGLSAWNFFLLTTVARDVI